ncbi:DUF4168 domain-containing protein [Ancylothrix sp. C2]|uniref:DUF4168 domain-containing protein n=1 Tax=Ancylothrix sp. D3o TaxID=2953691 RepID=UPI0021BA7424|nr:DUF4168 domain-containing protein [Ancylothrix sp. D3o]MCT7952540.1 DUF4168 domain-containing protein [Ancylothrix sp. D3o]
MAICSAILTPVALAVPLPSSSDQGGMERSLDAASIPSEKVSQFVRAYVQVLGLVESQISQWSTAETTVEQGRPQPEIAAETVASVQAMAFVIIEQYGLTKQEYFQMLSLANTDAEFGERVAAQLQADFADSLSQE